MKKMLFFDIILCFVLVFNVFCVKNAEIFAFYDNSEISIELKYDNKKYYFNDKKFHKTPHTFEEKFLLDNSILSASKDEKIAYVEKCISAGLGYEMGMEVLLPNFRAEIDALDKTYFKSMSNAKIKFNATSNPFDIQESVRGRSIDREKLFHNIFEQYKRTNNIKVNIPFNYIEPTFTTAMAKKLTAKRSHFSTSYESSTPDRKSNVKTALAQFNGMIIEPGQSMSFNDVVGKRTEENGYRNAKIILDGEYVEGVGGGVCQASTTLYNAVLLADLQVNKVQRHSRRVSYVPPALDAMVNWNSSDMEFVNTTDNPIYIRTYCTDKTANVDIYGMELPDGVKIKTESEIIKTIAPPSEEIVVDTEGKYADHVYYDDEYFYLHNAKDGVVAKSYLVKTLNGDVLSKKLLRTEQYPPERATKVVGANKRPVEHSFDFAEYLNNAFSW